MRTRIQSRLDLAAVLALCATTGLGAQAGSDRRSATARRPPRRRRTASGRPTTATSTPTQYAPLDQIDAANVSKLAVAWKWDSPDNAIAAANRAFQPWGFKSTPLMIGGRLYVNTSLGHVAAIDAATGKTLWVFDSKSRRGGPAHQPRLQQPRRRLLDRRQGRASLPSRRTTPTCGRSTPRPARRSTSFGARPARSTSSATLRHVKSRSSVTLMSSPLVVGDVVVVGSSISDGPARTEMPLGRRAGVRRAHRRAGAGRSTTRR